MDLSLFVLMGPPTDSVQNFARIWRGGRGGRGALTRTEVFIYVFPCTGSVERLFFSCIDYAPWETTKYRRFSARNDSNFFNYLQFIYFKVPQNLLLGSQTCDLCVAIATSIGSIVVLLTVRSLTLVCSSAGSVILSELYFTQTHSWAQSCHSH